LHHAWLKKLFPCGCQLVLTAGRTGHQAFFFQRGELAAHLGRLKRDRSGDVFGAGAASAAQSLQNFALPRIEVAAVMPVDLARASSIVFLRLLPAFLLAVRADTKKFYSAAGDAVADFSGGFRGHSLHSEVVNAVALDTIYMMMLLQLPVKTLLPTADFQFPDHTCFGKNFKISVNGGQTYARHLFFKPLVQSVGSGVSLASPHLFEDKFALMGHSQRCLFHDITILFCIFYTQEIVENYYYVKVKKLC
jgi:hypothetical protein